MLHAIRSVLKGKIHVSKTSMARIVEAAAGSKTRKSASPIGKLSDREFEIFALLGRGVPVKQIAAQLLISGKTIEAHQGKIKEKLGFKTARELTVHGVRWAES